MVSSVSPGGCHSGQVVLVVIIALPVQLSLATLPLHERVKRSEFREKLSLCSDETPEKERECQLRELCLLSNDVDRYRSGSMFPVPWVY